MVRYLQFIKTNWVLFTVVILVTITVLSLWPLATLPDAPGSDKLHHFIAYAFLAFPGMLRNPRRWLRLGLFFVAYSGGIELLQPYVNRYCEWADLLANTAGVGIGMIAAVLIRKFFDGSPVRG